MGFLYLPSSISMLPGEIKFHHMLQGKTNQWLGIMAAPASLKAWSTWWYLSILFATSNNTSSKTLSKMVPHTAGSQKVAANIRLSSKWTTVTGLWGETRRKWMTYCWWQFDIKKTVLNSFKTKTWWSLEGLSQHVFWWLWYAGFVPLNCSCGFETFQNVTETGWLSNPHDLAYEMTL